MQFVNLFKTNNLDFKTFIILILVIQFSLIGLVLMDTIGINIPILRQLIGFIYLLFIPGALILRILRINNITTIETILYSVGLSLAVLMALGFLINLVYPIFGILNPLNSFYVITTISAFVLLLIPISFIRCRNFSVNKSEIILDYKSIKISLFIIIFLILSLIGTYIVNFYQNNILLMLLMIIISISGILVSYNKIPKSIYPFFLFIISISILFHISLISSYLIGFDIHLEYYLAHIVNINSFWDPQYPELVNSMLSIVILAPIVSIICDLNLIWVFKLFYPIIFALVPLGLFTIYKRQTNDKIAFLSVFFFICIPRFFYPMPRQNIAEFFLILMLLLIFDRKINSMIKSSFLLIFGFSMVISHYALSYIFIASAISTFIIIFILEKFKDRKYEFDRNYLKKYNNFSFGIMITLLIFALSWYIYLALSIPFNTFLGVLLKIFGNIYIDTFDYGNQGIGLVLTDLSPLQNISKYLHLISQFLITIGLITAVFYNKFKFLKEYKAFSIVNFFILILCLFVPYFAGSLNTDRLYHISLIFLAPFIVIGALSIFEYIQKYMKIKISKDFVFKILSVFFMIFFLFNVGFIYEIFGDHPNSIAISQKTIQETDDINIKSNFYSIFTPSQDVFGSKWIGTYRSSNYRLFADTDTSSLKNGILISSGVSFREIYKYNINTPNLTLDSYIYLKYFNLRYNMIKISGSNIQIPYNVSQQLNERIYDNGNNSIYLS